MKQTLAFFLSLVLLLGLCVGPVAAAGDLPFTDVAENAGYYDAVAAVYEAGLVNGVTKSSFAPAKPLTRETFATMLYRLAGEPEVEEKTFADVKVGAWYADAAAWFGSSTETFGVGKTLSFGAMAEMAYDYAQQAGLTGEEGSAIDWSAANGILSTEAETDAAATRADGAVAVSVLLALPEAESSASGEEEMDFEALMAWMMGTLRPDENSQTVAEAVADPHNQQVLYLWEKDNMPNYTEYTVNDAGYSDEPDFRPFVATYPVPEGTEVKGAVVICPGGAFAFRNWGVEGEPVALGLNALGYQCFVVGYRCNPWTQEERGYDLARAVRFARKNAEIYGFEPEDIAVVGFSAGGILCGELLQNCDGLINGTKIDPSYVPDALDEISADAAAAGMGYSFYGELSHASTDVEKLAASELPPTYYFHGSEEGFYDEITKNIEAVTAAGVKSERLVLEGLEHGFGGMETGWFAGFDAFLTEVFAAN